MSPVRFASLLALAASTGGCTDNTYIIGALCGSVTGCAGGSASGSGGGGAVAGAGGSSTSGTGGVGEAGASEPGTLVVDLTGSGVDRLPEALMGADARHFLVATDATRASWPARVGEDFDALSPVVLEVAEPGPFADPGSVLAHASGVAFTSDAAWADTSAGALGLEVVFRGEPSVVLLAQRDADAGLEWFLDATGSLNLRLSRGADELVVSSQALVTDAWHHCLALFDAAQGVAQMFCNGQAGDAVDVPSGFSVAAVTAAATLGGAATARLHWAQLASWQAASWSPRGEWADVARERFARLVGTYAEGSSQPVPLPEVRASGAYIDMSPSDAPERRRLHPVGEHWPRVVCRPTDDSPRLCGLLVETSSSRFVASQAFELDNWDALATGVAPSPVIGPRGTASLFALTPSAAATAHTVELEAAFGQGPAVLSFFAQSGSQSRVQAEVVGVASAMFDIAAGSVLDSSETLATSAEPWGDGLVRLSFSFPVDAGDHQLRLTLLDAAGSPSFTGDGSVAAHVGDVELRFHSASTPLPTFGTIQQSDQLAYPANDGNLPLGPAFSIRADVWLPVAPLLADAAVLNVNAGGGYDPQLNLFVRPADGTVQFWGRSADGDAPWLLSSSTDVTDGALHELSIRVDGSGATLDVDGETSTAPAADYDLSALDRVEVGASTSSSGPLTGIVRRIVISGP